MARHWNSLEFSPTFGQIPLQRNLQRRLSRRLSSIVTSNFKTEQTTLEEGEQEERL